MSIDLFQDDLTRLTAQEFFDSIQELQAGGAREGYRLDFKASWEPAMTRHVAALANTLGGLIIIGVTNDKGATGAITGVTTRHELTTQIASSIATTISPRPRFTIIEHPLPLDKTKHLALIRVEADKLLHLLLTGNNPVYVRNEDQSIPADARTLRMLVDRERQAISAPAAERPWGHWEHLLWIFRPTESTVYQGPASYSQTGTRSQSGQRVMIAPIDPLPSRLDHAAEKLIWDMIQAESPGVAHALEWRSAETDHSYARSRYQIEYVEHHRQHHIVWIAMDNWIGVATQNLFEMSPIGSHWSLLDTVRWIISMIHIGHHWWLQSGYLGDALFDVFIETLGQPVARDRVGFISLLDEHPPLTLPGFKFERPKRQVATTQLVLSFADRTTNLPDTISRIVNDLLRDLGFSLPETAVREGVHALVGLGSACDWNLSHDLRNVGHAE
jgi:hypothetical protein